MSSISRTVQNANDILLREFGRSPSDMANLAWGFSEPDVFDWIPGVSKFHFVAPEYTADGQPVLDYYCSCGKNVAVHSAHCTFTVPRIRMSQQRSGFQYYNVWQIGRWIPPPDETVWLEIDGTLDNYPRQGRHVQFSVNGVEVAVRKDEWHNLPAMTEKTVVAFKDHIATAKARAKAANEAMLLRDWTPPRTAAGTPDLRYQPGGVKGSKYAEHHDRFKQQMTYKGSIPGQKGNVSWGTGHSLPDEPLIQLAKD